MSGVTESRFCPICEQIVPREIEGVVVKISPARRILLHPGCAERVYNSYLKSTDKSADMSDSMSKKE